VELTITEVAELTRIGAHTLRYYEKIRLLTPIARTRSGHRRYSDADLAWLEFIRRLRATGMPICEMQQFAALRRRGDATIEPRRELLEVHQASVRSQIVQLKTSLAVIEEKIAYYRGLEKNATSS